jgi:uncharacterized protein YcaQ
MEKPRVQPRFGGYELRVFSKAQQRRFGGYELPVLLENGRTTGGMPAVLPFFCASSIRA